jgi:hypothetical protein
MTPREISETSSVDISEKPPARSAGVPMWLASIAAFCVAAAFFNFAVTYRPMIILAAVGAGLWFGFAWLCRHYPTTAYLLVCFLRGLLGSRR